MSNPSERGTEGRASKAPREVGSGLGRGLCPLPRKFLYFLYQNVEFLRIPGDINMKIVTIYSANMLEEIVGGRTVTSRAMSNPLRPVVPAASSSRSIMFS